jgi:hypothetical protein
VKNTPSFENHKRALTLRLKSENSLMCVDVILPAYDRFPGHYATAAYRQVKSAAVYTVAAG